MSQNLRIEKKNLKRDKIAVKRIKSLFVFNKTVNVICSVIIPCEKYVEIHIFHKKKFFTKIVRPANRLILKDLYIL